MGDRQKSHTLVERTISGLTSFQGMEIAQGGGSQLLPLPIRAPSSEHLDFGAVGVERTGKRATQHRPEKTKPQTVRHVPSECQRARTTRAVKLLGLMWLIAVLVVVNEFYGRSFLDSRWLSLGTYRTIAVNLADGRLSATVSANDSLAQINLTGIAYSSNKPSAVIGSKIVHVGDVIFGATITNIDMDGVTFAADGQTWMQKVQ